MKRAIRGQLAEIFGGNMNVAPGGTGAVLTRPSRLSMDMAQEILKAMPLDGVYREMGAVVASALADELEAKSLRPADYAELEGLSRVVAKRLVGYLLRSEEFSRGFVMRLKARG